METQIYTGKTPWHGQGVKLPEGLTVTEALDTDPILSSPIDRCPMMLCHYDGSLADAEGQFANVRRADKTTVGYVGPLYTITQHRQMAQLADNIAAEFGAKFEIAGTLREGSQFVLQARVGNPLAVRTLRDGRPDEAALYLTLGTTHDGTRQTEIGFASVRAECANMTALAMQQARKNKRGVRYFQIRHTGDHSAKLHNVADVLKQGAKAWASFGEFALRAADTRMTPAQFADFAQAIFPDAIGQNNARAAAKRTQLGNLFATGQGNYGETAWDAYNAVTEWTNYYAGTRNATTDSARTQSRLNSVLFAQGADLAIDAENALRVYVGIG
jgi:phage/plasmid-like protein (TIGR03299 family)